MTTALASLLSGRLVRSDVAMTGEVSLTGRVLPIGGLKQKLLAAHRAGITTVLIPKRNEPDLDDVPEKVREALEIHLVSDVREVLGVALESGPHAGVSRGVTRIREIGLSGRRVRPGPADLSGNGRCGGLSAPGGAARTASAPTPAAP